MPMADNQDLRTTFLPPLSLPLRDRYNLQEAYDAYRVFCENGSDRIAWRNLALCLTAYLNSYFRHAPDGRLQVPSNPARVDYLAKLDIAQLGYLVKDVLWVLFQSTGLILTEEESISNFGFSFGVLALTRKYLSSLHQHDLEVLLADVTNELNERTPLRHYRRENSVSSLPSLWSPKSRTELGILHYLDLNLSPKDASVLHPFKPKLRSGAKVTISSLPKRFLKRALSIGSISQSMPHKAAGRWDNDATLFGDFDSSKVPRAYTEKLRNVLRHSSVHSTDASNLNNSEQADATSTGDSKPVFTIQIPESDGSTTLASIPETYEDDDSRSSHTCENSESSDADSVRSSQTLDSLLDFYIHGSKCRNASSKSISNSNKPDIVEIVELRRSQFQEQLSLARQDFADSASFSKGSRKTARSEHKSFVTAKTRVSAKPSCDPDNLSGAESFASVRTTLGSKRELAKRSSYRNMLSERGLIPPPTVETNWSGRGQHAEFNQDERDCIPLEVERLLGQTRNAVVESVRCKRIRLVRKVMRCTKWTGLKREEALSEVQHLYRIQHSHIVRLVGTYVIGSDLAILTYPCAEWNLEQFMETTPGASDSADRCASLRGFFTCLAKVLDFMHSFPLKHMDIKPQNLLVRDIKNSNLNGSYPYKIYFTDFGISRAYESVGESETETPTSFTRAYAAMEVVLQEVRGLSADIFSLGCVYTEMLATILDGSSTNTRPTLESCTQNYGASLSEARGHTKTATCRPYYSSAEDVQTWLATIPLHEPELLAVRDWTTQMIDTDPAKRPNARQIAEDPHLPFACLSCTLRSGPDDFEVAPLDAPPHSGRVSDEVPNSS